MTLLEIENPYGVLSWAEMSSRGVTLAEARRGLADKTIRRIRRGWYAFTSADATVLEAVTAGGVLSCLSALKLHGVWVPVHTKKVHVRGRESAHRGGRGRRFCKCYGAPEPEVSAVDDVRTAFRHALKCLDDEGIVVICDSLLHKELLEMCDLEQLMASAPRRIRRLLARCDSKAESGTETMVRLRLQLAGIKVRTQVKIKGVGRVDLLVGTRLIIEVDSEEFHDRTPEQREKDRRRDEAAARLGYVTLRFSYQRVVNDWDQAEDTVRDLVRRREHLKKLPTGRRRRRRKKADPTAA
ncbi:DUF559 domain-containing protein [Gordonia sp. OPL2]|uniref:DUF559 domain-containing protein n=1 Tax=Gordonia sp. OPL2 TaxID=2486274 RepID=UPI001655CF10|nr:DUF559 domain-containing protein [Gordonia sp. OPL2]ROZ98812.1 DUF559 domain-containing protein [Gordonia sp. OPL2]